MQCIGKCHLNDYKMLSGIAVLWIHLFSWISLNYPGLRKIVFFRGYLISCLFFPKSAYKPIQNIHLVEHLNLVYLIPPNTRKCVSAKNESTVFVKTYVLNVVHVESLYITYMLYFYLFIWKIL